MWQNAQVDTTLRVPVKVESFVIVVLAASFLWLLYDDSEIQYLHG